MDTRSHQHTHHDPRGESGKAGPGTVPGTAVDPICGMTVLVSPDAIMFEHAGETHYFCGEGCKQAFERQHAA